MQENARFLRGNYTLLSVFYTIVPVREKDRQVILYFVFMYVSEKYKYLFIDDRGNRKNMLILAD